MIIEKNVEIRINNINKKYYINFYPDVKTNDIITVDINDLSKGASVEITAKCDNCNKIKIMPYKFYYKFAYDNKKDGHYYCTKCVKIKRTQKTNMERYGFVSPIQNKEIKNKIIKTTKERYGYEYALKNDIIKEKQKQTNIEKYGVPFVSLNENIRKKQSQSKIINLVNKYTDCKFIFYNDYTKLISLECKNSHLFEINRNNLYNRYKYESTICTKCNPVQIQKSDSENQLFDFIKSVYGNKIIKSNKIINPYELDIYLPDLNLAFEFNGLYWHNELYKDKNYHKNKTDLCNEKGIHLIHIYEDDWLYKQDIVKSMILNKLGKNINKIFARKCEVKEIDDNKLIRKFLDENHIQGFVGSSVKLGLFYGGKLVSLMTFGKLRKPLNSESSGGEYEMLRFCNKLNTNVIGGASKLFKYFIINHNPEEVVSYADRSYSNGNLYMVLGFELEHLTPPNYFYIINRKKYHRYNFRKDILVKQGYDSNKSEHDIMLERRIYRIYNSGNYKFIFKSLINDKMS